MPYVTETSYIFTGPVAATAPARLAVTGSIKVSYRADSSPNSEVEIFEGGALEMDLTTGFAETIVPGSVAFELGGKTYFDRAGLLYTGLDMVTGAATAAGEVNYQTGGSRITTWTPGAAVNSLLKSLLTSMELHPVDSVTFRVPVSPLQPGSVQILATKLSGGAINVTADLNGKIEHADVLGLLDYATGVTVLRFGQMVVAAGNEAQPWYNAGAVREDGRIFRPVMVYADSIKYNAVGFSYLPLNADILGLDPVRLPQDGRVAIYRVGDVVVVGHSKQVTAAVSNGQTINAGRVRLSRFTLLDDNGARVHAGFTQDLEAGTLTFHDVTGYAQPITVIDRIEDMRQLSDVEISGQLAFTAPLSHAFPLGSTVSSALIANDRRARVSLVFDQQSWTNVWSDVLIGNSATTTYNDVDNPIVVSNRGTLTERWAVLWTTANTFQVIGEHVGIVATGTKDADLAPLGPLGVPYFILRSAGWGVVAWPQGSVLRFNTVMAHFPYQAIRTVQQGRQPVGTDFFTLLHRGGITPLES